MTITTSAIIFLIGRIVFGGYFLMMGLNHFGNHKMLTGYAASKKVPMPGAAVYLSGILIFLGGAGVISGWYRILSLVLIIAFLLPVSFIIHSYWKNSDPTSKMADMTHFFKNMALIGASLMLIASF